MRPPCPGRPAAWGALLLTGFLVSSMGTVPVLAADTPPAAEKDGELWEVTSQMTMEGMPMAMPARTVKVCAPKEWKEPPAAADDSRKCVNSDFKSEGTKVTWKVKCAGPPPMSGEGEINRAGSDAWSGQILFAAEGATMKMKLDGKKVGAGELKK